MLIKTAKGLLAVSAKVEQLIARFQATMAKRHVQRSTTLRRASFTLATTGEAAAAGKRTETCLAAQAAYDRLMRKAVADYDAAVQKNQDTVDKLYDQASTEGEIANTLTDRADQHKQRALEVRSVLQQL